METVITTSWLKSKLTINLLSDEMSVSCKKCSSKLAAGTVFCAECGTAVSTTRALISCVLCSSFDFLEVVFCLCPSLKCSRVGERNGCSAQGVAGHAFIGVRAAHHGCSRRTGRRANCVGAAMGSRGEVLPLFLHTPLTTHVAFWL